MLRDVLMLTIIFSCVLMFAIPLIFIKNIFIANKKIKQSILNGEFISAKEFLSNWIAAKHGNKGIVGYKYNDSPGCYVILIFDNEIIDGNYSRYKDVYVGQSINMCQRIRDHLSGDGNGDVYADFKFGKHMYIKMIPCANSELNIKEKELIRSFNATKSYNKTRGGSAYHY